MPPILQDLAGIVSDWRGVMAIAEVRVPVLDASVSVLHAGAVAAELVLPCLFVHSRGRSRRRRAAAATVSDIVQQRLGAFGPPPAPQQVTLKDDPDRARSDDNPEADIPWAA